MDTAFITAFMNAAINESDHDHFNIALAHHKSLSLPKDVKFVTTLIRGYSKFKEYDLAEQHERIIESTQQPIHASDQRILLHSKGTYIQLHLTIRSERRLDRHRKDTLIRDNTLNQDMEHHHAEPRLAL